MNLKRILPLVIWLFLVMSASGQTLTVTPLNAGGFVPNSPIVVTGINFRRGFDKDQYIVHRFSVTLQPGNIPCLVYQVDEFRLYAWLPANIPQGLSHVRIEGPFFIVFVPIVTQQSAPIVKARGRFSFNRPAVGGGSFDGVLTFPRSVGLMTITLEAGGLGLGGGDWTVVVEEPSLDHEEGQFAIELEAVAFPASSANPTDVLFFRLGRLAPGSYKLWAFRFAPNGTIVKSPKVDLVIASQVAD